MFTKIEENLKNSESFRKLLCTCLVFIEEKKIKFISTYSEKNYLEKIIRNYINSEFKLTYFSSTVREKCPNIEYFLVCVFLYLN